MARIKNMGTATMRFGEGVIVSGSTTQPDGTESNYALIVSGNMYGEENIYLSDASNAIPTVYFNDANSVFIQEFNNNLLIDGNNDLFLVFDESLRFSAEDESNPVFVCSNDTGVFDIKGALFNYGQDNDQNFSVSTTNQKRAIFVSSSDDTVMFHAEGITPAPSDTSTWFSGSAYDLSAGFFDPSNFGEATGRITQFSGDVVTSGAIVGKNNSLLEVTGEGSCLILAAQNSIYGTAGSYGFYSDISNLQDIGGDAYFFVSGSIGGRGQEGTAVFGGDILVSGTLNAVNGGTINISQGTSFPQNAFRVDSSLGTMFAAYGSAADVDLTAPAVYVNPANNNIDFFVKTGPNDKAAIVVDAEREYIAFMSGGLDDSPSATNPILMSDTNFFVSGAFGSRGGSTRGTAVFGGDVVMSGVLSGRYNPAVPGNNFYLQSHEFYFLTTNNDLQTKSMAPDENIFFTGSIGSRGTSTKGTAVFGGDVVTSGSLVVESQASFEDYMIISVSADNTDLQTGTGLVTLRAPFAMDLYQIPRASLSTNGTTQTTVDINVGGTTIMNTNKLTIDANEGTSTTAATAAALTTTSITDDQQITIDVDAAGTGARGLKVTLYYRRTF